MKKITLNIKHCDECPFYKRINEQGTFWIECEKTKRVLYDENSGKIEKHIPPDCPLENAL